MDSREEVCDPTTDPAARAADRLQFHRLVFNSVDRVWLVLPLRGHGDGLQPDREKDRSHSFRAGCLGSHRANGFVAFDVLHRIPGQNARGIPLVVTRTLVGEARRAGASLPDRAEAIDNLSTG